MDDAPKSFDAIVENVVSSPRFRYVITDVIEHGQDANQQTILQTSETTSPSTGQYNSYVQQTSVGSSTQNSSRRSCTFSSPVAEFNAI